MVSKLICSIVLICFSLYSQIFHSFLFNLALKILGKSWETPLLLPLSEYSGWGGPSIKQSEVSKKCDMHHFLTQPNLVTDIVWQLQLYRKCRIKIMEYFTMGISKIVYMFLINDICQLQIRGGGQESKNDV